MWDGQCQGSASGQVSQTAAGRECSRDADAGRVASAVNRTQPAHLARSIAVHKSYGISNYRTVPMASSGHNRKQTPRARYTL